MSQALKAGEKNRYRNTGAHYDGCPRILPGLRCPSILVCGTNIKEPPFIEKMFIEKDQLRMFS